MRRRGGVGISSVTAGDVPDESLTTRGPEFLQQRRTRGGDDLAAARPRERLIENRLHRPER